MKRRALTLGVLAAFLVALPPAARAQTKGKDLATVTVTGAGMDKKEALRDAQRKAVEQGAGTYIYSESKTRDFALVKDTVLARAAGFVQSYEILSEKRMEDGTWEVRIRAVVSVKGVVDAWGAVKTLLQQMGRPRIVVFLKERIGTQVVDDSTVQARIENLLLKSGFILVDKKQIEALAKKDKLLATLEDKPDQFLALLKKTRAQIVITGTANCETQGRKVVSGVTLWNYEAEANVRCYRTDTGQLLSKIPGVPTRGSGRVARSAAKMALDFQAQQIAPLVQRDVLQFWQDAMGGLGELELHVENMSFKQYVDLKKKLAAVKGVKDVTGQYNKALTTVSIQSDVTAEVLAERIAEGVSGLEISDVSQNVIKAKFGSN
ncbi:MAG TPA: hypothetical protein VMZ50_06825 [Phycisphaerae bacterium]|nr:hypothetical protein [Phycisphaerae bacterium]